MQDETTRHDLEEGQVIKLRVKLGDRMKELRYVEGARDVPTYRALEPVLDRSRTSIGNLLNNEYDAVNLRDLERIATELARAGHPVSLSDIFELQVE